MPQPPLPEPPLVVVVGSGGCLPSGFVGLLDILLLAQRAIADQAGGTPFRVVSASLGGCPVRDGHGRLFEVDAALEAVPRCGAAIVPGFVPDGKRPPPMTPLSGTAAWLRRQHSRGALVGGSCSGVFLLGEAGLLDGRRCTTTWWLHDELRQRYPRADAAFGSALAEDGRVVSAGGPLSWVDLALHAVRRLCGPDAARLAADFAVVDLAPSLDTAYAPAGHLAASDPLRLEAERIVRHAGVAPLSARDLARQLATSERTLHRRIKLACGETPKRFIDRIRMEAGRVSLDGAATVQQAAAAAGYADAASFRRTFKRHSGVTPGAYRAGAHSRKP